jgi:hypothetical protein
MAMKKGTRKKKDTTQKSGASHRRAGAAGRADENKPLAGLEKRVGVPHEVQDFLDRIAAKGQTPLTASTKAIKTFAALNTDAVAPAQVADLTFDIDSSTTAKLVRVYLPGKRPADPDIVNSQNTHGVLHNQVVGTFVTVIIEVAGNPNDVGVIDVKNAEPDTIKLKVSDGPVGTKPLFVTG